MGGEPRRITGCPKDDEAWGKKILSQLQAGRSVVIIDNIEGKLYAPTLAAVLTTDSWEDRVLGRSEMVRFPNIQYSSGEAPDSTAQ